MKRLNALCLLFSLAFTPAALADPLSPAQKQELGDFIREYLISHPQVLRETIEALDKRDKQVAEDMRQKTVTSQGDEIYRSKFQADVGNPTGTTTLVEFFDYNCHYCKGALPDLTRLMKENPNLHLVLKDFPVLGPGSVEAARVASAVRNQLQGEWFWDFHLKLMGLHGPTGKKEALSVAKEMGLDMDRIEKDMSDKSVDEGLNKLMATAGALQIDGTPTFVLGDSVVVGAVGYEELKAKINAVQKCGHVTC